MKKISCLLIALLIMLSSFTSCFSNSDKELAKEIYSIVDSIDENNSHQRVYEQLSQFLTSEKCDEIINEYYSSVFCEDSPQEAYASVYGSHDALLLHLGRYEDFKNSVEQNVSKYSGEQYSYVLSLWIDLLVSTKNVQGLDSIKIQKIIIEFNFDNAEIQEQWNIFLYYWNLFWDLENPKKLKDEIIYLRLYESYRMSYVSSFLMYNKYEDFSRLFVQEYQNDPFTGTDIMYLIQQGNLTDEQLSTLDTALENLEEAYRTNRTGIYPLKKEIIDNLQEMIKT